jgi:undecaprenyl-diphosphatase
VWPRRSSSSVTAWPVRGNIVSLKQVMKTLAERVHTGAHCPSDAAGGAAVGPAAVALVRRAPRLAVRLLRWQAQVT